MPHAVNYVSAIDIQENIERFVGFLGGLYGLGKSRVHFSKKTLEAEEITLTLIHLKFKSE